MTSADTGVRLSPLDAAHRRLGARMVPFGGWEMPLSYPEGTIAEHLECRRGAVAFDVSHLGTVRVEGDGATGRLQSVLTNDLRKVGPGRAQYTHLLDEADASVLDDIIVWWLGDDRFDVMPNASNTTRVRDAVGGADVTSTRAVIAVQGPEARARLAAVSPEAAAVGRFRVEPVTWRGVEVTVAGTGYTGEDGVELAVPVEAAEALWQAVGDAGILPAGLGARDTLRLEAALPLHGHELGPGITPLQAGLGWVVAWAKPEGFRGRAALEAERSAGVPRTLVGLVTEGRQPPRAGATVLVDGRPVGEVTSGNFSPVLGHGIALALLASEAASGLQAADLDLRGRRVPARVTSLPFVAKQKG
ncbi:MAG TPA: glycine cleavage system aminomethyltransferase GcvT [Acidimicrobiales bacterium]|nr:glycine cleavage system aminomethyltransferase GcvT [Acidimicrobiales bacterium]